MGKLDHQFWKPDSEPPKKTKVVNLPTNRKKKTRKKKRCVDWPYIRDQACKKLKVHKYTSWNGLADMISQKFCVRPATTRHEARIRVKNYVENGPSIYRNQEKPAEGFYSSHAWKELRYIALRNSEGCCNLCGARAADGLQIHVDHIVPRSVDSSKELDLENTQVLCGDCNVGKSNRDSIDRRKLWESI